MTRTEVRVPRTLALYGVIGVSGVLLDYLVFLLLLGLDALHPQVANAISTTVGITNNFLLNALLNFRTRDRFAVRFLRFYAVGLTGLALTFVVLQVFSGWLGLDPRWVKGGALPVVVFLQYTVNKKWSFG
ncbi:GtrA family protein [Saccharopolyspora cebuensis]|uniref:GtrA family protein n=1 Tax=Saccharopolyspora cebuensis TaxID=418759 RepID=A0ABV4CI10_9PSEU